MCPDDPAMIGEAFAANLLGTAALAHGVDQLDAIGVDDPSTVGAAKKACVQSSMGREGGERDGCARAAGEQGRDSRASATR